MYFIECQPKKRWWAPFVQDTFVPFTAIIIFILVGDGVLRRLQARTCSTSSERVDSDRSQFGPVEMSPAAAAASRSKFELIKTTPESEIEGRVAVDLWPACSLLVASSSVNKQAVSSHVNKNPFCRQREKVVHPSSKRVIKPAIFTIVKVFTL